mgnify:CR=1 FL=1
MLTSVRLSIGTAWLVIVAAEMLTGGVGIGFFIWDAWNSSRLPDIVVAHVQTPTRSSQLGAKGAGEAGTAGAPAAVMNAINDALAPFGAGYGGGLVDPFAAAQLGAPLTDASRAVGVATQLLSKELKAAFVESTRLDYIEVRERTAARSSRSTSSGLARLATVSVLFGKVPSGS